MSQTNDVFCRPVTPQTLADFERLFTSRGAPHYCWCAPFRRPGAAPQTKDERRELMCGLIAAATPVGVLAYDGAEPIGWCSVAPRETFPRLAHSRVMPRVTAPETPTWAVTCFFVPRPYRGSGLTGTLLGAAVDYARASGAAVIEGYAYDTAGIKETYFGHSSIFAAAGFEQDGRRWSRTLQPPGRDRCVFRGHKCSMAVQHSFEMRYTIRGRCHASGSLSSPCGVAEHFGDTATVCLRSVKLRDPASPYAERDGRVRRPGGPSEHSKVGLQGPSLGYR